jgi:hypothetical protein
LPHEVPADEQHRVGGGFVGSPALGAGAQARPSQQVPSPVHAIGASMHAIAGVHMKLAPAAR